ncbi:YorP family protein [Metabacillus sp. Hm71]|uniref:YorP family protein n=1 Tax=Metabacillus sp. Hm71 TaxID=3450743 RepID=UPI003F42B3B6
MPKYFIYNIGDELVVNDHAKKGAPYDVGKKGEVVDRLEVSQYDYELLLEDGTLGRFKEIELNKVHK